MLCAGFLAMRCSPKLQTSKSRDDMLQIAKGLQYFRGLAAAGRPKVVALRDAVMAGNLPQAKNAYIKSRNEYEQIEVLAPGFPNIDCSIDCRACALHSRASDLHESFPTACCKTKGSGWGAPCAWWSQMGRLHLFVEVLFLQTPTQILFDHKPQGTGCSCGPSTVEDRTSPSLLHFF
jgi:hypothetical protein